MKKVTIKVLTKSQFKQFEVAVMAIHVLGGAKRSVDTEDAAMKCHEFAPNLFSWQKYKDQINLELVRVSLSDAKKLKNGSLLTGSGREGWRLSSKGLDWIRSTGQALFATADRGISQGSSKAGSIDVVRRERERNRLFAADSWQKWRDTGEISTRAAREVFRIDEYTTGKMLEIKVARIRAMFNEDDELSRFLLQAGQLVLKKEDDG
jgi:hypothetical protein